MDSPSIKDASERQTLEICSIEILQNMRHASVGCTPNNNEDNDCEAEDEEVICDARECVCSVCKKDTPFWLLTRNPTWSSIMRVVFFTLMQLNSGRKYFSLRTDVYQFVIDHWSKICSSKKRSDSWKKQLQDTLSHNKRLFISGFDQYKQNGFWGLKQVVDPWEVTDGDSDEDSAPSLSTTEDSRVTEYKAYKSDILRSLEQLEGTLCGIRAQVQTSNSLPSASTPWPRFVVAELEGRLQQIWSQTEEELQCIDQEIQMMYQQSNTDIDLVQQYCNILTQSDDRHY